MALAGIALGVLAFLIVGPLVGEVMMHNAQAGFLPGVVAGIWAAWPFFHRHNVQRYNFLHPVPKRYNGNSKQVFEQIVKTLEETRYHYGDRWDVKADTASNRIVAHLRYTEEESHIEPGGSGLQHRTKRVQRYIGLETQMKPESGSTIVQFDFDARAEGWNSSACDSIISGLMNGVEVALGPGTEVAQPMLAKLPAPPWWLLGVTVFTLLCLFGDVMKALFGAYRP